MKMCNKAVDEFRRNEALTGNRRVRESLKKTRQMWLWGEETLPVRHMDRFEKLKVRSLKTAKAWRVKERMDNRGGRGARRKCHLLGLECPVSVTIRTP